MYPNELTMISEFLNIRKIFAFVSIFIVFSGVHTVVIEFGAVSLYQLMQQNRAHNIYGNGNVIYRNGNSIDIEVPKGRGVQIVPTRLGLFNRAYYPRQINIRLQKPEPDSSSHEKHHRRHSSEDHSGSNDHHKHHKRRQRHRHRREQDDSDHYDESKNRYEHDEPFMEDPSEQHHGGHRSQEERRDEYKSGSNESSIREHDDDRHLPYDDDRHRPYDDDNRHRPHDDDDRHHPHDDDDRHRPRDDDDRHRPHDNDDDDDRHRHGGGSYHDNDGYLPDDDAHGGDSHRPHDDDNRDNPDVSPYDNRDEYGYYEGENNYPYDAYDYGYNHDDHDNRDHSKGQSDHHGHPDEGNRDHSKGQNDHHRHPGEDDPYNHEREHHTSNKSDEEFHDAHETLDDMPQQESHHKLDRRFSLFSPLVSSSDDKDLQTLKPTSDAALDATVPSPTDDTTSPDESLSVDTTVSTPSDNIPDAAVSTSIDDTSGLGTSVSVDTSVSTASDDVQSSTNVSLEPNSITSEPETTETSSSTSTTSNTTETSTTTSTSSSSFFSWLIPEEEPPKYSPYTLLKFLSPTDTSPDSLSSMFSVFSDPTNTSYLQNASTMMRVVLFFMPGTGIVDQVYFTMAISKIMWEAATMYYEGYGEIPIAITVLSDLAYESYLARRDLPANGDDSSIIQKTIILPGECIDVSNMDVPTFLKYIRNMEYPALTPEQEKKLRYDIDNLVSITYPTISEDLKTSFVDALRDSSKFLALVNVKGDLIADHVDVNFSDVYVSMHAAFDNDSLLDKLMKKVEAVVETIKHIPDLVMDP